MPDVFDPIRHDVADLRWPAPGQVRQRGRQLARHRSIAAGLAALVAMAVGGGSVYVLAQGTGGGPPPRPAPGASSVSPGGATPSSAPPSPHTPQSSPPAGASSQLDPAVMLQPADLGTGYRFQDSHDSFDDHGTLSALMGGRCRGSQVANDGSQWLGFYDRDLSAGDRVVFQRVIEFKPGYAVRHVTALREAVAMCPTIDHEYHSELTLIASNFTGDEALLVKDSHTDSTGRVIRYHLVIRRGDLEALVRVSIPGLTDAQARSIGTKAADRLCAASPAC
jgi:hypothetical protein